MSFMTSSNTSRPGPATPETGGSGPPGPRASATPGRSWRILPATTARVARPAKHEVLTATGIVLRRMTRKLPRPDGRFRCDVEANGWRGGCQQAARPGGGDEKGEQRGRFHPGDT